MRIIGIVGSNAQYSTNRLLLQFIQKQFGELFELEIVEIIDIPIFSQQKSLKDYPIIESVHDRILSADGVIIATPEHNHTIPSCLKSLIEWLSYALHPFQDKPVMVIGASYYKQGSSRAQVHLRQILNAPGVNAWVLPSNEFLLNHAREAFDENGNIRDLKTVAFLETCLKNFVHYVELVTGLSAISSKTAETDADTGASASYESSTQEEKVSSTRMSTDSPFENILDTVYGRALAHSEEDPFEVYLQKEYDFQSSFEQVLDREFGRDLGIEKRDILDELEI